MERRSSKNDNHYDVLTGLAHRAGFRAVTPSAVQSWVKHGLIPRVRYVRPSFGVRTAVGIRSIGDQLIALCQLRYDHIIRSHAELAVALWAEGWHVDEGVVRKALRRYLVPFAELGDAVRRDEFAYRAAQRENLPPSWRHGNTVTTAMALETLAAVISGARHANDSDLSDLAYLENVSGLDRARRDRIEGIDPWLPTGPGVGLAQGAEGIAAPRLLAAVDNATSNELISARESARRLDEYFRAVIPMMAMGFGGEFAGFGSLTAAIGDPRLRIMLVLVALVVPDDAARMVAGLPNGTQLAEWQSSLETARRMLAADDQLASRAAVIGLVGAVDERSAAIAHEIKS